MNKAPLVSIILATYNRAGYILESVMSIHSQSFKDWECLIIDDGGTDNTQHVLTDILLQDNRFHYLKRSSSYHKGLPGTRNYGLDLAKGEYIIFFDDDDIVHPLNLELCIKELADEKISFCRYLRPVFTGDFDYNFDYSKEYTSFFIDKKDICKMVKNELQFNSCAVMWRSICFKDNRFVETLMYAEEWELYSRILSCGFTGLSINKSLFYGRKHLASNTGEFYNNNSIRRASYVEAILLVIRNLKKKNLLEYSLKRYFITTSINFNEYNLFEKILNELELHIVEKIKWKFFYSILPFRLFLYRIKNRLKKIMLVNLP